MVTILLVENPVWILVWTIDRLISLKRLTKILRPSTDILMLTLYRLLRATIDRNPLQLALLARKFMQDKEDPTM
jgi:hypothetical protein